jgi:hypothetical protein
VSPGVTLPNFFLVGPPKAGTTSFYYYLKAHPQIFMSPIKEPSYFAEEIRAENFSQNELAVARRAFAALPAYLSGPMIEPFPSVPIANWADYVKLFGRSSGFPAVGEASPTYLWSKSAARNIAAAVPAARIIMILRNPIERAFSEHRHGRAYGLTPPSFAAHIDAYSGCARSTISSLYPFLEFGLYHEQVKRFFDHFPRHQVRIYLHENYDRDPRGVVADACQFLGVDSSLALDVSKRYLVTRVPRFKSVARILRRSGAWDRAARMTPRVLRPLSRKLAFRSQASEKLELRDRQRLADFYRDDVYKLSELLGRDLSAWIRPIH